MNNLHLALQFFLQLAVILLFCRIVGAIAARLGQPQVVAEMLAGLFASVWSNPAAILFFWLTCQVTRPSKVFQMLVVNAGRLVSGVKV